MYRKHVIIVLQKTGKKIDTMWQILFNYIVMHSEYYVISRLNLALQCLEKLKRHNYLFLWKNDTFQIYKILNIWLLMMSHSIIKQPRITWTTKENRLIDNHISTRSREHQNLHSTIACLPNISITITRLLGD